MGQITWNTDVNAPCCPGEIVNDDGRTLLIQTDWDYPGTAQSFGWDMRDVQKCDDCGRVKSGALADDSCDCGAIVQACGHESTDGTVDCKACGCTAGDFIAAAREWLDDHDGATADDPGYFLAD